MATGDWDGIVMTHGSFERVAMSPEYQEYFVLNGSPRRKKVINALSNVDRRPFSEGES